MADHLKDFGDVAKGLSRNPLGIIALFIVLVYGLASSVSIFSSSMTAAEREPIIYFLVIFPVIVLAVFAWLVSCHSEKLFAPSDFKDEANYIRTRLSAAVSLGVATTKSPLGASAVSIDDIVRTVQDLPPSHHSAPNNFANQVLWVDDRPENNVYERQAFEAVGITFKLSLNTQDALDQLSRHKFASVISDMGRKEGPREGYALLDAMRQKNDQTPLFFYATSRAPEHIRETKEHGGQGCTNDANELFQMVTRTVIRGA
jgi:CheY-like chemotaxis protein